MVAEMASCMRLRNRLRKYEHRDRITRWTWTTIGALPGPSGRATIRRMSLLTGESSRAAMGCLKLRLTGAHQPDLGDSSKRDIPEQAQHWACEEQSTSSLRDRQNSMSDCALEQSSAPTRFDGCRLSLMPDSTNCRKTLGRDSASTRPPSTIHRRKLWLFSISPMSSGSSPLTL